MRIGLLLIFGAIAVAAGCGDGSGSLAQVVEARGPIDRQSAEGVWAAAAVGTKFYLREAARTADGEALLRMLDGARFTMKPHTILRFGGKAGAVKMGLDFGELEFKDASGNLSFDFGELRLSNASGTVSADARGEGRVLVNEGIAEVFDGTARKIDKDHPLVISGFKIVPAETVAVAVPVDAGVDAPPAIADTSTTVQIDVKGKTVEILRPNETKWTKLPPGKGEVPAGAKLRIVSGNSSATLISYGNSLELVRGAKVGIEPDRSFVVESGTVTASVPIGGSGTIELPGGRLSLKGTSQTPSSASINVTGREAKVTVLTGLATLIGDVMHAMSRGETASLALTGKIEIIAEIPKTFDIAVPVGDKVNIHDPKGSTAVQFTFPGKCPGNGVIEVDRSSQFAAVQSSEDKDLARIRLTSGTWLYRLRCVTAGGALGPKVEDGRVTVLRDSGQRTLPRVRSVFSVRWDDLLRTPPLDFVFQADVPDLVFDVGRAEAVVTIVRSDRTQKQFKGTGKITAPGPDLSEGMLNVTIELNGKETRRTQINLIFNNMSPIVFIEGPANGKPWGTGPIVAKGAVLPGWTAAIDGTQLPLSSSRSFEKAVARPAEAKAIAIKLSHPRHGVHYYLRRETP